ncbi:MAG: hypothetical protein AMXMBFR19_22460 [Chthonomonadaceae bacterium]|uniref:Uncharacterized protein n=1 Tax=Candidatus Nitrosymbiomonas proteolyticus TaxID=2608984 RepID=A0A809S9B0_9BACT|nr:hypothetical protein NPRO_11160 [Candidatus Nitrosymbiomonas proteolyticus]
MADECPPPGGGSFFVGRLFGDSSERIRDDSNDAPPSLESGVHGGRIDPPSAPGHEHTSLAGDLSPEFGGKRESGFVSVSGAYDRNGKLIESGDLAEDEEDGGRAVAELERVVRRILVVELGDDANAHGLQRLDLGPRPLPVVPQVLDPSNVVRAEAALAPIDQLFR